jgi:hypothetical protein
MIDTPSRVYSRKVNHYGNLFGTLDIPTYNEWVLVKKRNFIG